MTINFSGSTCSMLSDKVLKNRSSLQLVVDYSLFEGKESIVENVDFKSEINEEGNLVITPVSNKQY